MASSFEAGSVIAVDARNDVIKISGGEPVATGAKANSIKYCGPKLIYPRTDMQNKSTAIKSDVRVFSQKNSELPRTVSSSDRDKAKKGLPNRIYSYSDLTNNGL